MSAFIQSLRQIKYELYKYRMEIKQPKDSYGQLKEDLVIKELFDPVTSFIDIGANDGITFSNTYLFAREGAVGLCFEPICSAYLKLKLYHFRHKQITCIREGISDNECERQMVKSGYESTLSRITSKDDDRSIEKDEKLTAKVKFRPLSYWLKRYPKFQTVDLVSIDVEGHEAQVLSGIDFQRFEAKCIVLETEHSDYSEISDLLNATHVAVLCNGLNTFFVSRSNSIDNAKLTDICKQFENSHYRIVPQ